MHWGSSNGSAVGHIGDIYMHVNASKTCTNIFSDVYEVYLKTCPQISSLFSTRYAKGI